MQFCTSYRQNPDIKNQAAEIRYSVSNLSLAIDQLNLKPDHIAIIEVLNISAGNLKIEDIHNLVMEYDRLYFDFYILSDFKMIAKIYSEQHYMYHYPVTNWIDLNYLLHFDGLHAITIGEPLVFDLHKVKTLITRSRDNIQIRVWPTIGRPSMYNDYPGDHGLCHFWILPQHTSLYDPYIDIMDILDEDEERESVLCKYYFNNQPWVLRIEDFFKNMNTQVIGSYVLDSWVEKRLNCGQRCFMPSPTCHYCENQNMMYDLVKAHPEILERKSSN